MVDPRFFSVAAPLSLKRLAQITGAEIGGDADPDAMYSGVAPLAAATPDDVSFIDNRRYADDFRVTGAGACLVAKDMIDSAPSGMALLITEDPYRAYALVAQEFYPPSSGPGSRARTASVDSSAKIGDRAVIAAGAVIGANCEIGAATSIGAGAVIGDGVTVGENCIIGPSVTLACCQLGDRVILHSGARIGQDGYGFAPGKDGHTKVPQLGRVLIEDDVEIGANTTIDRGAGPDTVIGAGTKIDNLVQIGHNVHIGKGCLIVAQVGISGSTHIGDFVMIGGQAGIAGHLTIGDGARIAGQAGVTHDVPAGVTVAGMPAINARDHWRRLAVLGRLTKERTND